MATTNFKGQPVKLIGEFIQVGKVAPDFELVKTDLSSFSLKDLKGKNVAVKNGTAGADFANSLKDEYGFTVTVFEDSPTMYQDVILGNSAACVEDTPIMAASIKEGNLALKIPEGMESDGAPYGLAIMDEKNQELLDMFNKGLEDIKANGTYDEIIAKYLANNQKNKTGNS